MRDNVDVLPYDDHDRAVKLCQMMRFGHPTGVLITMV
jgi:hypothetical protein